MTVRDHQKSHSTNPTSTDFNKLRISVAHPILLFLNGVRLVGNMQRLYGLHTLGL